MNVRCPSCRTVYRVDPAKVPEAGIRARCTSCGATIPVRREAASQVGAVGQVGPQRLEAPVQAAVAPRPAPPPAVPAPPRPAPQAPARPPAAPLAAEVPVAAPRLTQPFIPPRAPQRPAAPSPQPAPRPAAPVFRPTPGQPVMKPPVPPAPPAAPRPVTATPAPASAPPPVSTPKPVSAPTPVAPAAAPPRKPINPFLQQDPQQKARRLARALVSDMIVYQPDKRQRALAEGNLKEAFEEEIEKSWEEYVEQVGEELAASTAYWREALNEILAGGRPVF